MRGARGAKRGSREGNAAGVAVQGIGLKGGASGRVQGAAPATGLAATPAHHTPGCLDHHDGAAGGVAALQEHLARRQLIGDAVFWDAERFARPTARLACRLGRRSTHKLPPPRRVRQHGVCRGRGAAAARLEPAGVEARVGGLAGGGEELRQLWLPCRHQVLQASQGRALSRLARGGRRRREEQQARAVRGLVIERGTSERREDRGGEGAQPQGQQRRIGLPPALAFRGGGPCCVLGPGLAHAPAGGG